MRVAKSAWYPAMAALVPLAIGPGQAQAQPQLAESVEQGATPLDRMEMANPPPPPGILPAPSREGAPFTRDARFSAQLRTFYFNREKYDDTTSEAWALGGSITLLSGYLGDLFRIGAVGYTSQPLYAPEDRDGSLLLKPGQDGYAVLGQIYAEIKLAERAFAAIGRKEYDTPYLGKNDVRMTPNTFEGVSLYGNAGGKDDAPAWRFGGGYITKIKEKNSDEFKWMSTAAGATAERGVFVAGANFDGNGISLGAINYYSKDVINILYTEGSYALALGDGHKLKVAAQFTDQRSTGDELLTGQSFSTRQWGIKGDMNIAAALLTVAYTETAKGADIRGPWNGHPAYASVQVQDFDRAGESALMVKGAYDFTRHGAEGLSAYALWVRGSGRNAPNYNEDEADLNLQWTPAGGAFRGTSFRLRYAHITQRGGGDPTINDLRVIVNYNF